MVWRPVVAPLLMGLEPMSPMILPTGGTKIKSYYNPLVKLNLHSPFVPLAVRLDAIELTDPLLIDTEDCWL
jgi:hypothetical protein